MGRRQVSTGGPFEDRYGYCRAVRVGDHVHVAGTTAQPPHVDGCDAEEQARAAIGIIADALARVDASLADVVRTVTYVTDIADMEAVARAHREAFGGIGPVATLVEVSALALPEYLVEIEAYAIVDTD